MAVVYNNNHICSTSQSLGDQPLTSGSGVWKYHFTVPLIEHNWLQTISKSSSYIAQYPVLRTAQSALHFTSLTDLFTQIPSRLLWEASSHMLQLMREGCSYTYPPLSIVRYSFKQLSELEQCRVKKLVQGFNAAAMIRTRVLVVESPKLYP